MRQSPQFSDLRPPQFAYSDTAYPLNSVPKSVEFDIDYSQGAEFVIRIGSPTTVGLIFRDQVGSPIARSISGGLLLNDSSATLTCTMSGDGKSALIAPKTLGSAIIKYVLCSCLTTGLIVRVTNRVGPLSTHHSVRRSVLDYVQAIDADYRNRTIDDIIGSVGADRQSIESALESLAQDGFVRRSGEFWLPLNPAAAFSNSN
jgi:hypothetical protein